MDKVTVSGKWLEACGMGNADREFKVIRIEERASFSAMGTCFVLDVDGREWTVFGCRLVGEHG